MGFIINFFVGFFASLVITIFTDVQTTGGILIILVLGYLFLNNFKKEPKNWNNSDNPNFQMDTPEYYWKQYWKDKQYQKNQKRRNW